jgi:hypothetical protein
MDYTFENTLIKQYFNGDDSYLPTGELMYLHKHPLVTPNFLTQISELILDAGKVIKEKNMTGYIIVKFEDLAIEIGTKLPEITTETAPDILKALRELYILCNRLIGKPQ